MKGLLIKDFKLLKNQKAFFLVVCAIGILFLTTSHVEPSFFISYMTFIFAMFTLSTISYDEYDNGSAFLFSLPVSRSKYTAEKYVYGFLLGGGAWAVSTVVCMAYQSVRYPGEDAVQLMTTAVLYLSVYLVFLSVILPVQLKFGAEKGRIAMIGAVAGICVVCFISYKLLRFSGINLDRFITGLSDSTPVQLMFFMLLISGIILCISYMVSRKVMEKKEF